MVSRREVVAVMATMAGTKAMAQVASPAPSLANVPVRRDMLASAFVPGDVAVSTYVPAGHGSAVKPLPLMLLLHGGLGSDQDLLRFTPAIDRAIREGHIPPMALAMPAARRSAYMDFKDKSERWEQFILADLLPHLRRTLPVSPERRSTFIGGISMGGLGALRIAFKYPELFGAVAAVEPAIDPALSWGDVGPRSKFFRSDSFTAPIFGAPVDADYWAANNPASIAKRDPDRLIGLPIYLEVGDQDMLYLNQGVEFLHRILFDASLAHEYRLVHGADHVGPSIMPRVLDAIGFIGRQVQPPGWIDDGVLKARAAYDEMKRATGYPVRPVDPRRIHDF